ncbi:MAG TPA: HAMP domain-containing sensor histidine kinase [Gemmatimonadales bacterium]
MSFRTRLFLAIGLAVMVPLGALAWGVRQEMERRLTTQYQARLGSIAAAMEADLTRESQAVAARLDALASELTGDNRFRLAALQGDPSSRKYLLDYAGEAMRLSGLSLLQIQDSSGRILSSGHFRNQFDRLEPELPRLLSSKADTLVLVRTRTPEAALLAFTRVDSFRLGSRNFTLVGGIAAEPWLRRGMPQEPELAIALTYPGVEPTSEQPRRVLHQVPLPYVDLLSESGPRIDTARLTVTHTLATLDALRQSVNRWFLIALALTVAMAVVGAAWMSSRISRPLRELASKTAEIDLDRLDQSFASDRRDEIGALSRLLGAMTERLRNSSVRLREAERRAAVGDLARQVNHDIKNGLAPIRNVLRHFSQVAQESPHQLAAVFEARRGTLDSSVEYLDKLARNYDRLSPGLDRGHCDVNGIVEQVLRDAASDGGRLRAQLAEGLPSVLGDSLMIRRILENLVGNALDSIAGKAEGTVTVTTDRMQTNGEPRRVRIMVADTGSGMSQTELDRAFDDFYSTKPGGTGLGLSIVRRLILDLNGTLRVETEPGVGTRMIVELPTSPGGDAAA